VKNQETELKSSPR